MNKFLLFIFDWAKTFGMIIIKIVSFIALIFTIRWLGYKGIIGIIFGMSVMAYLILSDNKYFYAILKVLQGENLNDKNIIKEEITKERKYKVKFKG